MQCPHCSEENLLGASICAACGRNMRSMPAFRPTASATGTALKGAGSSRSPSESSLPSDASSSAVVVPRSLAVAEAPRGDEPPEAPPRPEMAPPPATPALPVQSLCRACLQAFDRAAWDTGTTLCPSCRSMAPSIGDSGQNDVRFHPATEEREGVDPRSGGAIQRKRPVEKRVSLRRGPIAIAVGSVLAVVGMGIVLLTGGEEDPTIGLAGDVKPVDALLEVNPPIEGVTALEATYDLDISHEVPQSAFSSTPKAVLDVSQKSVQTVELAFARMDLGGAVMDAVAECRLAMQTGRVGGIDGREAKVYPWEGHRATQRLLIPIAKPAEILGAGPPLPGRDVPPFLTLGDIGAPHGTVSAGTKWKSDLTLPFLADRDGHLITARFPCEMTYLGQRPVAGHPCVVVHLTGHAPAKAPPPIDDMNRTEGTISCVLFFATKTGLLVEAHARFDVSARLERGKVEDAVRVSGAVDIRRR